MILGVFISVLFSFCSSQLVFALKLLISLLNTLKNHALYNGANESFKNFFSNNCSAILNYFLCATKCINDVYATMLGTFSHVFFCFLWPSVILLRYTITHRCIHWKRELYTHTCVDTQSDHDYNSGIHATFPCWTS